MLTKVEKYFIGENKNLNFEKKKYSVITN